MKKIPKQEYTAEFRELAVKRVKEGLTPSAAAKELGVNHQPYATGSRRQRQASLEVLATRLSRQSRGSARY